MQNHHRGKHKLTKEEFQEILKEVGFKVGFAGRAKDILLFIFGIPVTGVLVKNQVCPEAVTDEIFIPAITAATVFLLGKMQKL